MLVGVEGGEVVVGMYCRKEESILSLLKIEEEEEERWKERERERVVVVHALYTCVGVHEEARDL